MGDTKQIKIVITMEHTKIITVKLIAMINHRISTTISNSIKTMVEMCLIHMIKSIKIIMIINSISIKSWISKERKGMVVVEVEWVIHHKSTIKEVIINIITNNVENSMKDNNSNNRIRIIGVEAVVLEAVQEFTAWIKTILTTRAIKTGAIIKRESIQRKVSQLARIISIKEIVLEILISLLTMVHKKILVISQD